MKNPDAIGWKIPALYDDELLLVPVPNDEPGQDLEGALEIGTMDAIKDYRKEYRLSCILNKAQIEILIVDLQEALKTL